MAYLMPTGCWYALFVTADLSVETINEILDKAMKEQSLHDEKIDSKDKLFENRWVLIRTRSQTNFEKPTKSLSEPFKSDFIDATVDELGQFVHDEFGTREDALGRDSSVDSIATNIFGILDAQTAQDQTILCVSEDMVNARDEAEMRVAWGIATRQDQALLRYAKVFEGPTDEDIAVLVQHMGKITQNPLVNPILSHELASAAQNSVSTPESSPLATKPSPEDVERLERWFQAAESNGRSLWIGLRLGPDFAFQSIGGIMYRGGMDYLAYPEDEFDENGVLKAEI